MRLYTWIIMMVAILSTFLFSSCQKQGTSIDGGVPFSIKITNVPSNYEQVNIHVKKVEVLAHDKNGNEKWIELDTRTGVYNISSSTNNEIIIAHDLLEAVKVSEVKVYFGNVNNIVKDRKTIPLQLQGNQPHELHLMVDADLNNTESFTLVLDIDASSVKDGGRGVYVFNPDFKARMAG